jgi:hypothetical protein
VTEVRLDQKSGWRAIVVDDGWRRSEENNGESLYI